MYTCIYIHICNEKRERGLRKERERVEKRERQREIDRERGRKKERDQFRRSKEFGRGRPSKKSGGSGGLYREREWASESGRARERER
jgi:hypothetical protein